MKFGLIFCIALAVFPTWAQVRVIAVDTALGRNSQKSLMAAMAFSAVLPGSGQEYLKGDRNLVRAFIWSDAGFWGALLVSHVAAESYMRSAQSYAARYAGLYPPADPDFLDDMARWRSRQGIEGQNSAPEPGEDYNQDQLRGGSAVDQRWPATSNHSWNWGSSDDPANTQHMDHFSTLLRRYRMARISFQVAAGALVLNRFVSMAHALRLYRSTSHQGFARRVETAPWLEPGVAGGVVQVHF